MQALFNIDQSTKEITRAKLNDVPPVVFSLSFAEIICSPWHNSGASGRTRLNLDVSRHIASHLTDSPNYIDSTHLPEFLEQQPATIVVFVGCMRDLTKLRHYPNFFSVQLDPSFDKRSFQSSNVIITTNPKKLKVANKLADYVLSTNLYPSRAELKTRQHLPSNKSKVLVYFRMPCSRLYDVARYEQAMLETLREVRNRFGCGFLISNSIKSKASKLHEFTLNTPGSEFCNMYFPTSPQPTWESFLNKATVAIVTDDTTSTISDCCVAGIPTFLFTRPENVQDLFAKTPNTPPPYSGGQAHDFNLQRALLKQEQIKIFSMDTFCQPWTPPVNSEWDEIGAAIANRIKKKHAKLISGNLLMRTVTL